MKNYATKNGTFEFLKNFPHLGVNLLGDTELSISQAGFGTYRISNDSNEHYDALKYAIQCGINIVDTSSNFTEGSSELCVGRVLKDLFDEGLVSREQVVIVSKAGYIQGQNLNNYTTSSFSEVVDFSDDFRHCIHPDFLCNQIDSSLERLGLDCIDFYLLHNPENYLIWAQQNGVPLDEARGIYYDRLERAFEYLEYEVERGRIMSFGVSSNSFSHSADSFLFTSLEKLLTIAENIHFDHHFKLVQMPMNLLETAAKTEKNHSSNQSVIDFAYSVGLSVLVNRPLNALEHGQIFRLADISSFDMITHDQIEAGLLDLLDKQDQFFKECYEILEDQIHSNYTLKHYFDVYQLIQDYWIQAETFEKWSEMLNNFFLPRLELALSHFSNQSECPESQEIYLKEYVRVLSDLFGLITNYYKGVSSKRIGDFKETFVNIDLDWNIQSSSFSAFAITALISTAGVTGVLVGMRSVSYVNDVMDALKKKVPIKDRIDTWEAIKGLI